MIRMLDVLARGKIWWIFLLLLGISMIGIALVYQHMLSEWPCVLCIQVRILFLLISLLGGIALLIHRLNRIIPVMHGLVALTSIVLLNRSWILLTTERGWSEGACSIDLGMPAWFAIDQWLPNIFAAWTTCGYTPVIALGVTMAEALLLMSLFLLTLSVAMLFTILRKQR